jgi:hypothetical protein
MARAEMALESWGTKGELEKGKAHIDDAGREGTVRRGVGPKLYHYMVCPSFSTVSLSGC